MTDTTPAALVTEEAWTAQSNAWFVRPDQVLGGAYLPPAAPDAPVTAPGEEDTAQAGEPDPEAPVVVAESIPSADDAAIEVQAQTEDI